MSKFILAATIAIAAATGANAASLSAPFTDAEFNAQCGVGEACLIGAGEFRLGDLGGNAEKEIVAGKSTGGPLDSENFAFTSGTAYDFSFSSDGTSIMTAIGSTSASYALSNLGDTRSLFIRGVARNGGQVSLTDLMLDGMALGDITFGNPAELFQVAASDVFALSGKITFGFDSDLRGPGDATGKQGGSFNAVQFKVTDLAPIPLPAAAWMLIAAFAGLGGFKLRQRPAA